MGPWWSLIRCVTLNFKNLWWVDEKGVVCMARKGGLFTEVWSGDVRGDLVVIRSRMERGNLAISDDWWRDDECLNLGLNINLLSGPVRSVREDKKVFASTVSIVRHHDITPRHRYTNHRRSCMHTIRAGVQLSKYKWQLNSFIYLLRITAEFLKDLASLWLAYWCCCFDIKSVFRQLNESNFEVTLDWPAVKLTN